MLGQFSQETGGKGRTEQHKIQIRPKQLVLITSQKKGSSEKTFTVRVVNKLVRI